MSASCQRLSPSASHLSIRMSDFDSAAELAQALSEISSWGLRSESPYQVLPAQFCGPSESRAKVELLEDGECAVIGVSDKGWKIHLRTVVDFSVSRSA